MESSPSREPASTPSGTSRPQITRRPSLLPAFEPLSSSPLPRASKRKYDETTAPTELENTYYPTPLPTSSTGVLPSSPPARPGLKRTTSTVSERTPLCAVPSIDIPQDGEAVLMGRSSNSSHYQLSANRLISRVHVNAAYESPSPDHQSGRLVVECVGWNGAKIHCRGTAHDLGKGDVFISDNPSAEIMLDVQDARVILAWPRQDTVRENSDFALYEDDEPSRRLTGSARGIFASSPPVARVHPQSPVSPSPANHLKLGSSPAFHQGDTETSLHQQTVQVYEDRESGDEAVKIAAAVGSPRLTNSPSKAGKGKEGDSQSKMMPSPQIDEFSDPDEENDPIVHSFGPFGDNLLPRLQSFATITSPKQSLRPRRPLKPASVSPKQPTREQSQPSTSPIKNHVINQLAFSRLHSIPLSTIFGNLPPELRGPLSLISMPDLRASASSPSTQSGNQDEDSSKAPSVAHAALKKLLDVTPCIGEINREGKDAAGKRLENEFYYIPEMDTDHTRRDAVVGGIGGTGLRAVRRNHKQYYWKRPRH